MNSKPDPRLMFEPELVPSNTTTTSRSWLPAGALRILPVARGYWLTRASRGISWNRSGRVSQGLAR